MSKIMILGDTGAGKSTSLCPIPEIGHKGVDLKTTFVISCTTKPIPIRDSGKLFVVTTLADKLKTGNRLVTNDANEVIAALNILNSDKSPFRTVIVEDINYLMQDYYMKNALSGGWDTPKSIGFFMGKIFDLFEKMDVNGITIVVTGHPQTNEQNQFSLKSTGRMVDEYLTPSGKFDVVLILKVITTGKTVNRSFVTNNDGNTNGAKSPIGMFPDLYIKNDLGFVLDTVHEYYGTSK